MKIRGLYAITPETGDTTRLAELVHAALDGGAAAVQYRHKSADSELALAQASALRAICRALGRPFIVNDSAALARAVDADGVHLGRDDGQPHAARALLGSNAIIGLSCYDDFDRAVRHRDEVDYCAFGSVYPSRTKPQAPGASLQTLTRASNLGIACVAIGGIDARNAFEVGRAGAQAIAVISALFGDESTDAETVRRNAVALTAAFSGRH